MSRLGLIIVSAVVITIVILANTLYIVTDRETAIKLRFGEIIDSSIEPGLHFKVPILHTIKKFDERVLTLDNLPQPYFTAEKYKSKIPSSTTTSLIVVSKALFCPA